MLAAVPCPCSLPSPGSPLSPARRPLRASNPISGTLPNESPSSPSVVPPTISRRETNPIPDTESTKRIAGINANLNSVVRNVNSPWRTTGAPEGAPPATTFRPDHPTQPHRSPSPDCRNEPIQWPQPSMGKRDTTRPRSAPTAHRAAHPEAHRRRPSHRRKPSYRIPFTMDGSPLLDLPTPTGAPGSAPADPGPGDGWPMRIRPGSAGAEPGAPGAHRLAREAELGGCQTHQAGPMAGGRRLAMPERPARPASRLGAIWARSPETNGSDRRNSFSENTNCSETFAHRRAHRPAHRRPDTTLNAPRGSPSGTSGRFP